MFSEKYVFVLNREYPGRSFTYNIFVKNKDLFRQFGYVFIDFAGDLFHNENGMTFLEGFIKEV